MSKYDFHFHSVYSDGRWDIDHILEYAKSIGMKGLILTDHDNLDGQKEFINKAKKLGIRTNTGIEITVKYHDFDVHILGYGVDPEDIHLQTQLAENRQKRTDRNKKVISRLRELGFIFSDKMIKNAENSQYFGRLKISDLILMNPKNHKLLKNPTKDGIFDEYLGKGGKAYIAVEKSTIDEVVNIIHQADGIASLAHPGEEFDKFEDFLASSQDFLRSGFDGIEVYTWKHTREESERYLDFAIKNKLLVTFGSDDHGWPNQNRTMGKIEIENDEKYAEELFERIETP